MADYSHPPPFGMPFPMPPQYPQHPQHPQHGAPNSQPNSMAEPSDPRQAPFADAFQFNGSIPGLNLQSYNLNAQQPQYQQQWPQAPPAQLHEQLQPQQQLTPYGSMQFPQFIGQNGLPMPPPPPLGAGFFPPPMPQQPMQAVPIPRTSNAQAPPSHQANSQSLDSTNNRLLGNVFGGKEDGKMSGFDRISRSPAGNGETSVASRSAPHAPQFTHKGSNSANAPNGLNAQNGASSGGNHPAPHLTQGKSTSHPKAALPKTVHNMPLHREEAKRFVKILHENNFGYPALSREEGIDSQLLDDMYRDLNISPPASTAPVIAATPQVMPAAVPPTLAVPGPSSKPANGVDIDTQTSQSKPLPAVKTNVNPVPPAAPSPVDRKDYIARLQAARKGKQPVVDKVTPPQQTPSVTAPAPSAVKDQRPASATAKLAVSNAGMEVTEEEKAERARKQTEMIKQRLEMIKAQGKFSSSPATPQATTAASESTMPKLDKSSPPQQGGSRPLAHTATVSLSGSPSAQVSPFSKLPGLFMNSSTTTSSPVNAKNVTTTSSHKRPVASDFDEATTPRSSGPAYTRLLGESPHEHHNEQMIIDVSEDDSAGSDMDVDEEGAPPQAASRSTQPVRGPPSTVQRVASLPSLSMLPSRPTSARASPAVNTPPASHTPATNQRLVDLERQKKELEYKLKVREAIRKKNAALPKKDDPVSSPTVSLDKEKDLGQKVDLKPVPVPSTSLSKQNAPRSTANQLGTGEMSNEWKQQRRAQLENDIRVLDASLAEGRTRLSQIEAEKTELGIKAQRLQQDKEALVRELETLSINTEDVPMQELRVEGEETEQRINDVVSSQSQSVASPIKGADEVTGALEELKSQTDIEPTLSLESRPSSSQPPSLPPPISMLADTKGSASTDTDPLQSANPETPVAKAPEKNKPGYLPAVIAHVEVETPTNRTEPATPVDDEVDFYSPEPAVAPVSDHLIERTTSAHGTGKSPSEEGEVEMSESSSSEEGEVYEPEEYAPQHVQPAAALNFESHENEAMDIGSTPMSSSSPSTTEDEGEIYEPPETELEMPDVRTNGGEGRVSITQQPEVEDLGAMDTDSSSSYESDSSEEYFSETAKDMSAASDIVPKPSLTVADDLAPELQSQAAPATRDATAEPPTIDDAIDSPRFVPYESPLRMFKSYRYHPNFANDVEGGFLSLTYSHQIDPEKPLCPYEAVGGTCNDPQCVGQHFKGMGISGQYEDDSLVSTPPPATPLVRRLTLACGIGDKLLVQLGTANPGKSPEERQRWVAGLRLVLKKLREDNIKDPNGIAIEIAKYRRQFFEDDTRVVNM